MSTTTRRAGKPTLNLTHPNLAAQVHPDSPVQAHEVTAGSKKKPLWVCNEGHTWEATVNHRVNGARCKTCHPAPSHRTLNITHPELAAQIHPDSPVKAHEMTAGSTKKPLWVCEQGHTWLAAVSKRVRGTGCKTCRLAPPDRTLDITHSELAAQIHPNSPVKAHEVTAGSNKKPLWVCSEGHTWLTTVGGRVRGRGCPQCSGSQGEREVAQFVEGHLPQGTVIHRNDRNAIKPLELDIYVPELRFAVEYNGVYWHSDAVIIPRCGVTADEYHAHKQRRCEEQGITLVFVDEEDWETSREQCETRLAQLIKRTLTGRV